MAMVLGIVTVTVAVLLVVMMDGDKGRNDDSNRGCQYADADIDEGGGGADDLWPHRLPQLS